VLIQDNATIIGKLYEEEGYWLANIVPIVKKISDDEVSLTYQIDEGTKVKIRDILFDGNKNMSSKQIKKVMETKEWWLFSFVSSSGYYRKDQLTNDTEKIKNLYFDNGYIKAIIAEPEITVDKQKKGMSIKIAISEGDQYRLSSINFAGNKAFDNETIQKRIKLPQ
jgi:outer membrane protein insertion porin family